MSLCKSIESAIQRYLMHHGNTFVTIQNLAVYLSVARVSISPTVVPRLLAGYLDILIKSEQMFRNIAKTPFPRSTSWRYVINVTQTLEIKQRYAKALTLVRANGVYVGMAIFDRFMKT